MSNRPPFDPSSAASGIRVPGERSARTNLLLSGTIEAEDIAAPVRIRNLSETGALLEGAALPSVGARLILRRLQLEMGGTVMWVASGRCGVKFEGSISVDGWRSGNWIAPAAAGDQARVDSIQAAVRSGTLAAEPDKQSAAWLTRQSSADIDTRIAEELASLRRVLEDMGDRLSDEPAIVRHYPDMLQNFDLASQILGHLADVLAAGERGAAIDAIGMEDLRRRLLRKAGSER